jgi:RNA polymerase sigma factor (sigma-70 family)
MLERSASQCTTLASPKEATISAELMARHEGLVRWVVRHQWRGELSFADALHEGRLGLWRALRSYDPARGTAFSSYAVPAIRRAVWHAVAGNGQPAPPLGLASTPVDPIDPDEAVDASRVRAAILALVDGMPARLRLVIVAHYGLGETEPHSYASIGTTLHVTRQRVQQLHVEALLYLTHPAHSLALRRLLGLDSRACYQRSLAQGYRIARSRRRGERGSSAASGRRAR